MYTSLPALTLTSPIATPSFILLIPQTWLLYERPSYIHTLTPHGPISPLLPSFLPFYCLFHLTSHMTLCFLASTALHHFVITSHFNKFYFTHKARIKPRCKLWPMNPSHHLWGHIGLPYSLVTPLFPAFTFLFLTLLLVLVIVTFP